MEIGKVLENTSLVMIVALVFGLLFDFSILKDYLTAFLIVAMCFSLVNFSFNFRISREIKKAALLLFANYILLSLFILIPSFLLLNEKDYLLGFIILCVLPPAVIAIPYTYVFEGNKKASLLAEILGYAIALILIPSTFYLLFGRNVNVLYILFQLILFIVIPMGISRFLLYFKKEFKCEIHENKIVNLCFFLLNATVLSVSKQTILSLIQFHPIWIVLAIKLLIPFVIYFIYVNMKKKDDTSVSFTIFSSVKNTTLGIVIVLNSLNQNITIPIILSNILGVFSPLIFGFLFKK